MRTLSRDVASHIDKQVTVEGWLHKKRLLGGMTFILIRDRSGVTQVLVEDKKEVEKLRGEQIGAVLKVTGKVIKDDRAPGGAEIHDPKIEVTVSVEEVAPIEVDKPIDHKPENFDTLFENRPINLRNLNEQKIFKIRSEINRYIREYLNSNEFVEIQTPKLLAGATEGGAEVFKLDYFGQEATLAQSPQFYKQMMVGVFERVFEIGPAFRAEPSMTVRHMSELSMLDVEIGYIESYKDVLNVAQDIVQHVVDRLFEEHADILNSLQAKKPAIASPAPEYTIAQIHEMYTKATKEDTTKEKDLTPAEERWICDYAKKNDNSELVFVTELPVAAMKFYHKRSDENPDVALATDMLFRGIEIATAPVREHRYDVLVDQIKGAGIDPDHPGFKYYLMAFKYGLPPHGGFGFGIDRFVQTLLGLNNVKEATLFPRDINRLAP